MYTLHEAGSATISQMVYCDCDTHLNATFGRGRFLNGFFCYGPMWTCKMNEALWCVMLGAYCSTENLLLNKAVTVETNVH